MGKELLFTSRRTRPDKIEQEKGREGVALVIFNRSGQVLLFEERDGHKEYGRRPNHLNILTETMEPGEGVREAFWRAVEEEAGVKAESANIMFQFVPMSYRETDQSYRELLGYTYHYHCGVLLYLGDPSQDPNECFHSHNGEINSYRWVDTLGLPNLDIEQGAQLLIDYYRNTVFPL